MSIKIKRIIIAISVYALVGILSFFGFSNFLFKTTGSNPAGSISSKLVDGRLTFDSSAPKTEECPLNGVKYSKEQRDWWEGHRPLGVMIENHEEARPQSGLSYADVVYEAVAEGGITRFLAIFYCQDGGQVGPIRSARTYFMDFLSEYGEFPLYAHVGGANTPGPANALGQIADYDWEGYNDLNQFSIGFPTFWRDYDRLGHTVATEHTMYSTTDKLWTFAAKERDISVEDKNGNRWDEAFVPYEFKDDASSSQRGVSQNIHLQFWDSMPDYFVDWVYDPTANTYLRKHGASPHLDKDNNQQLSAKNVVVLSMVEQNANDGYENNAHLLYKNKGTGDAFIFMDGKEIEGTWEKKTRTSRTILRDSQGNEIKFNRGKIWFEILPTDGVIEVK